MDLSGLTKALDIVNGNYEEGKVYEIELSKIVTDPNQPRKSFDEDKLQELADDINQNGIIQPIIVRKEGDAFIIVTGERRFRACQLLNKNTIKALINNTYADKLGYVQVAENLKRDDLKFYELADFIISKVLAGDTQKEVSERIGIDRKTIGLYMSWQDAPNILKDNKDKFKSIRAFSDLVTLCNNYTSDNIIQEFVDTNELITVKAVNDLKKQIVALESEENADPISQDVSDDLNYKFELDNEFSETVENIDNSSLQAFDAQQDSTSINLNENNTSYIKDVEDEKAFEDEREAEGVIEQGYSEEYLANTSYKDDEVFKDEECGDVNENYDDLNNESLEDEDQKKNKFKKPLIFGCVDGREAELLYKLCPSTDGFVKVKYEDGFEDEILAEDFKINRIFEA